MTSFEIWFEDEFGISPRISFILDYTKEDIQKAYEAGYAEGFNQGTKDGSDYAEHYKVI